MYNNMGPPGMGPPGMGPPPTGTRLFAQMSATTPGVVTWDKFCPMILKVGWNQQQALQMWYQVDEDRGGSLDRNEFMKFCGRRDVGPYIAKLEASLGPPPVRVGEKAFQHIDDGDGQIAWKEFQPMILSIGWNAQTALQMWYCVDTDRSGSLDHEEFITFCNRPDIVGYIKKLEASLPSKGGSSFGAPGGGMGGGFQAPGGNMGGGNMGGGGGSSGGGSSGGGSTEKKEEDDLETCERAVNQSHCKERAAYLRKGMKGLGTNEKKLNEVIGYASKAEMQQIRLAFHTIDGSGKKERNLIKDLKSETSGNYERLLVALTYGPYEYDAHLVRNAVKGMGTNETQLSEVLCTRSPAEIVKLKAKYESIFIGRTLLKDVSGDLSGHLKKTMVNIINCSQKTTDKIDFEVEELYKAGEKRIGTNEKVFVEILSNRPRAYVEKIYWKYASKYNKTLDRVVRSEFSGNLKNALVALCTPLDIYFSQKLTATMKGMGTKDNELIRIVASQKERHLKKISKRFLQDNGKTLVKWVKGDCGGNYGKLLYATCENFGKLTY